MIGRIQNLIDQTTMYRVVLYGLIAISGGAIIISAVLPLGYSLSQLLVSLSLAIGATGILQAILARVFVTGTAAESWLITALILFLVLKPVASPADAATIAVAALLAVSSKFVLTTRRGHLANPVAFALVILMLLGSGSAYWWVGSPLLLPLTSIVTLLILYKLRRFLLAGSFLVGFLLLFVATHGLQTETIPLLWAAIASGPLVFFIGIMLTEPQTAPHSYRARLVFGALVGGLYATPFANPPLFASPELALLIGNLFTVAISHRRRTALTYISMQALAPNVYEFRFANPVTVAFTPGQYYEWTLPHTHTDKRGDRRYFTMAGASGQSEICLTVRIDNRRVSSFKRALLAMQAGDTAWIVGPYGEFVLPKDATQPIVWIAGGIGITPYISMIRSHIDKQAFTQTHLWYIAKNSADFAYNNELDQAAMAGLSLHRFATEEPEGNNWTGTHGAPDEAFFDSQTETLKTATFYLSGPPGMVRHYRRLLRKRGVSPRCIKTDYFAGI